MTEEASHAAGLPEDIEGILRFDGQHAVVTGAASGLVHIQATSWGIAR
ncbi:MAG TPA: hypothetical protein VF068_02800 [Rubrobacter sp.]